MWKRDGTDLRDEAQVSDRDDSVGITGMVRLVTEFGAFVIVDGRTIFIPSSCSTDGLRTLKIGETVTVQVVRWFAEQEALID
jgi:hypothetical protein